MNVTSDQDIDLVEFEKISSVNPTTHLLQDRPKAKDQGRILLGSGSYTAVVSYTRGGTQTKTLEKTTVITAESGSMAVRTNYLYFYRTLSGSYSISPVWPPIPNDAAPIDNLLDTLADNQGILEIINGAQGNDDLDYINKITINGDEYLADPANPEAIYMIPGEKNQYILEEGMAFVSFKPRNNPYGMIVPRIIEAKKITQLVYTRGLANPDLPDPNSGIIRITNNSSAVVSGVNVYNRLDIANPYHVGSADFTPPYPIQYGKVGRVFVDGGEFPLDSGVSQIIAVNLETAVGMVAVQRLAALKGQIVDIVINESFLNPGGSNEGARPGAKVTVKNNTITESLISGIYVYDVANAGSYMAAFLSVSSPAGSEDIYVLSAPGFPIVDGARYKARLAVSTKYGIGYVEKDFSPDGLLYNLAPDSNLKTITLNEADLGNLAEKFVPVTDITPSALTLTSYTKDKKVIVGLFNLNSQVTVNPLTATNKSIVWSLEKPADSAVVTLDSSTGRIQVIGDGNSDRTVKVIASIKDGKGVVGAKQDFSQTITLTLKYDSSLDVIADRPVQSVSLLLKDGNTVEIKQTVDLAGLVEASLNPSNPVYNNGIPITTADLTWTVISGSGSGTITNVGGIWKFTGTGEGTVSIKAEMPASMCGGTAKSDTVNITVAYPANLSLRIIALSNTSTDSITKVYAVKTSKTYSDPINDSGFTGERWAGDADVAKPDDTTWHAGFLSNYLNNMTLNTDYWVTTFATGDAPLDQFTYADVSVPWPAQGSSYYLFFVEGDNRVRGYVNPGVLDPPQKDNFFFFLNPRYLYDKGYFMPMKTGTEGYKEAASGPKMLPIAYNTWINVGAIMKSVSGPDARPISDTIGISWDTSAGNP
jgi:hypothetical protein